MTQNTFDETDVVRDTAGQFAEKTQSAPELSLESTPAQPQAAPTTFGEHELAFGAATKADIYDVDLAGKALRDVAARLCPTATAIRFSTNYTDEGASLYAYEVVGDDDIEDLDAFDDIVFTMSGRGRTGEEITGMRLDGDGDDQFIFDLTPQA